MSARLKNFQLDEKGIEFEVHSPDGKHLGDLVLKGTHLVWCKGRTRPENGHRITWEHFADWAGEYDALRDLEVDHPE